MRDARWIRALLYAALAATTWIAGDFLDIRTQVELSVWNGQVHWEVAGSTLKARPGTTDVDRITIRARAGILQAGGRRLETEKSNGTSLSWKLPHQFRIAGGSRPPVGDWWVDEVAREDEVFSTPADLGSDFTLRATFIGRFHQDLVLDLGGSPGVNCSFRRGLLNNDFFIKDDDGQVLASGSIDPQPIARLAAVCSTLLRAIAGGCLLVAIWAGLVSVRQGSNRPTKKPDRAGTAFVSGLIVIGVCASVISTWTTLDILDSLPHLPDEVVYRLQAHWLLDGDLTGPEPPCLDHTRIPFTYFEGGRWVGHYPPAWPLLLSPGVAIGAPWLIPALLRILNVVLVGLLGLRLGGRWTGLAAAGLAALSPLATLLFASWMPHSCSATLLLLALYLSIPSSLTTSRFRWMAVGLIFALAFAVRPLTAVAVAVPVGIFLVSEIFNRRRRRQDLILVLASGLLATAPTLAANAVITGSLWHFPYSLAHGTMMAPQNFAFGVRNLDALLASLSPLIHGWGWPWLSGPALMALPFAFVAVPFLIRRASREDRLLLAIAVIVPATHIWARAGGLHGYGPRYTFMAAALLWVLTARGAAELASTEMRRIPAAASVLVLLALSTLITLPSRLDLYRGYNDVDGALGQAIAKLPPCSLVLIPEGDWRGWTVATPWLDHEDPTSVVFATDLDDNHDLRGCFPDRRMYRWRNRELHSVDQPAWEILPPKEPISSYTGP
ncbi:MAG: hypothetical protein K8R59_16620 [Thermoanaerobaculales bacterium]|nr:hypothetical protein [Thermoanaerobaculales bacterium]